MELKFDKLIKTVITEAIDDEEESDSGNINFDLEDQDLPNEEDIEGAPASGQSSKINTPQELDFMALAINAINYNGEVNLKVYSSFEKGEGNDLKILNYVESLVGYPELEEDVILGILTGGEELGFDPTPITNKPISDRIKYYNKNDYNMPASQINFWTRLILNCLKYDGGDYNLTLSEISPESVDIIFSKLKQDFNYSVGGMGGPLTKDLPTGASLKGPGIF